MVSLSQKLKRQALRLHPARRRFRRFLSDLPLDPATLSRPLESTGPRDFIICGAPRTGTSLLGAMLHQPPHVVTAIEPWDGMRLPPAALFRSLRQEVESRKELRRSTLDLKALVQHGRVSRVEEGSSTLPIDVTDPWWLGVKWPVFYRYVELLPDTRFLLCFRHPYEVIASFKAIGGSVAEGLDYDTAFNREMNAELRRATKDVALRRVRLYDYMNGRLLALASRPNVRVVRYERWWTDPDRVLEEIGSFLGVPVSNPLARIKARPQSPPNLDPDERALIRRECRTAAPLGYTLD